jgi:uncharacterized protein (TIGR02145 family)
MGRFSLVAVAGLALVALGGCGGSGGGSSSTGSAATGTTGGGGSGTTSGSIGGTSTGAAMLTDPRDLQTYPEIVIGTQTWLAANMNYKTDGGASYCYMNDSSNCDTYGRLYTNGAAQSACPPGWHLASDSEWMTLETTLGMTPNQLGVSGENTARGTNQGTQLKEGGSSGFEAKLSGYGNGPASADFYNLSSDGYFWTSTPDGSQIWRRHVYGGTPYLYRFENPPATFAISVRCLMGN